MHEFGRNYTEEEAGPSCAPESLKACAEIETKCHEKLIFSNKTLPLSKGNAALGSLMTQQA